MIEKIEEKILGNRIISLGLENFALLSRIIAVVNPNSAPVKRMIKRAEEANKLVDATCGKPTRSAVITDAGFVILSSLMPRKIAARLEKQGGHHNRAYE